MITEQTAQSALGTLRVFRLTNASGASVVLSTLGAGVVEVNVPDKDGRLDDVALGYADPADYLADGPCAGKIPGRYANRIAAGTFCLDGLEYHLPINNGPNSLHGGPQGFQNQNWEVEETSADSVTFRHTSPDGDAGYPGTLTVHAHYRWTDDNELQLTLTAETTAKTVVNLTNHSYWNLAGHDSGSVLGQSMRINATRYLPTDRVQIPTGEAAAVAGTPMDFTVAKAIGRDIKEPFEALEIGKGYDHCWVVDDYTPGKIQPVVVLSDNASGRTLTVASDQPGVQIYTGNWLDGSPKNKNDRSYNDYDGVAVECQDFPDAPNKPAFPSTILEPGQQYCRHINFKFTAE